MTFTVKYRDRSGAVRETCIEAANRAECMAQCRKSGIAPLSLREGGAAKRRKSAKVDAGGGGGVRGVAVNGRHVVYALTLVGLLVVGFGVWSWVGRAPAKPSRPREPAKREKAKPKAAPAKQKETRGKGAVAAPVTNDAPVVLEPKTNWPHMWRGKVVKSIEKCYTNMGKEVVYFTTADGRTHCSERLAYKPVFENATDDLIAQALNTNPNAMMPPMPPMQGLDKEFLESLSKPIVINPDDSEEVRKMKESVIQARKDMKQMMDEGMSFNEVLQEHRKMANENVETRQQLMADVRQLVDAGESDEARKYLETVNPALEEMGLAPLDLPLSHEELMERRRENRRRLQEEAAAKANGK